MFRMWHLGTGSLWCDEYLTLQRVSGSLDNLLADISPNANQTLLYYLMMWLLPTHNEFLLRYPSALMGVIGIALMIGTTRRLYHSPRLALLAGALLAFNPYHIWLSRNARVYSMVFVFSLLVAYFFLQILANRATWRDWIGLALSSTLAYHTHYFMVLLPVTQFIMLAIYLRNDRQRFWRWVAVQAVAGSLILAWIAYQSRQPGTSMIVSWIAMPTLRDIPLTLWNMSVGYPLEAPWYLIASGILGVSLVLWGSIITLWKYRRDPVRNYWLLQFWVILIPLFIMSITLRPAYVDRYFMLILPALLMLLTWGITHLPRRAATIAVVLMAASMSTNSVREFVRNDYIRTEWNVVAAQIDQNRQPDEALLMTWPFFMVQHYSNTPAELANVHGSVNIPTTDLTIGFENSRHVEEFPAAWVVLRVDGENVHRIGHMPECDPFDHPGDPLSQWLVTHFQQITAQWHYNGVWVFHVDLTGEQRMASEASPSNTD